MPSHPAIVLLPSELAARDTPFMNRVFGLKNFIDRPNCSSPNMLVLNTTHAWPIYVSPGILLLLYYTATSLLKLRKSRPPDLVSPCHHLC